MNNDYEVVYNVGLFDDLHNYLPALLYDHRRFQTVADLLGYVHTQTLHHFNLFNRGRRQYTNVHPLVQPTPIAANQQGTGRPIQITTRETIDITPLFNTHLNTPLTQHGINAVLNPQTGDTTFTFPTPTEDDFAAGGTTPALDVIMNILQGGLLRPRAAGAMDPVIVRPTQEQIDMATTQRMATAEDEQTNCSICQDAFTDGQAIRQINHCRHSFHRACINPWFDRNVHCPVCRFDIRETE
jgi:hypothetical protein